MQLHMGENSIKLNTNISIVKVNLNDGFELYKVSVNPNPDFASVVLSADGYEQDGNSIIVKNGTEVTYTISADGFETVSDTIIVSENLQFKSALNKKVISLYGWGGSYYTNTPTPTTSDIVYDNYGDIKSNYSISSVSEDYSSINIKIDNSSSGLGGLGGLGGDIRADRNEAMDKIIYRGLYDYTNAEKIKIKFNLYDNDSSIIEEGKTYKDYPVIVEEENNTSLYINKIPQTLPVGASSIEVEVYKYENLVLVVSGNTKNYIKMNNIKDIIFVNKFANTSSNIAEIFRPTEDMEIDILCSHGSGLSFN